MNKKIGYIITAIIAAIAGGLGLVLGGHWWNYVGGVFFTSVGLIYAYLAGEQS